MDTEDEFKKKKQRKVLSIRNRDVEFDGNKESIINDYLIQLIDNIQIKNYDIEIQQLEDGAYQVSMAEKNEKKRRDNIMIFLDTIKERTN